MYFCSCVYSSFIFLKNAFKTDLKQIKRIFFIKKELPIKSLFTKFTVFSKMQLKNKGHLVNPVNLV
jgi:hypothetical protein